MFVRDLFFRVCVLAAILLSSALCAGWKWDIVLH